MNSDFRIRLLVFAGMLALILSLGVLLMPAPAAAETTPPPRYILRRWDGMVAVFLPDEDTPLRVTGMPVSCLPSADREALESGIRIETEEELTRLLEDYCS